MPRSDHPPASAAALPPTSDAQLLKRFAETRDGEAFREIVLRHEKLVLGVCRRVLWDEHEAEDAFQATFMILARRSHELHTRTELGGWLYSVAYRTAVRARSQKKRRRHEPLPAELSVPGDVLASVARRDELQSLDEELNRLPQKYREPLVLHYLLGRTQNEVAQALGLSVRTVEGRVRRGKAELRYRLARRGIGVTVAACMRLSAPPATAAPRAQLVTATVESAIEFATATSAGTCSSPAADLATQELYKMSTTGLSIPAASVAIVTLAVTFCSVGQHGERSSIADEAKRLSLAQSQQPAVTVDRDTAAFIAGPAGNAPRGSSSQAARQQYRWYGVGDLRPSDTAGLELASLPTSEVPIQASGTIDFTGIGEGEMRIRSALEQPIGNEYFDTPLAELIEDLARSNEIRIFVDPLGLAQEALRPDTPISFDFQGISLKEGLKLILDPLHLDYIIEEEFLKITSEQRAAATMETRVYDTRRISKLTSEALTKLIRASIRPKTWTDPTLPTAVEAFPGGLVIAQSQQAHADIADLMRQLERHEEQSERTQSQATE
jgi:RNA polymerase sigma factor (sigma-70 family)